MVKIKKKKKKKAHNKVQFDTCFHRKSLRLCHTHTHKYIHTHTHGYIPRLDGGGEGLENIFLWDKS